MLCCLNHRLCCYTKGFITFCFTDSLIREPLELSLPSETLILLKGSVLKDASVISMYQIFAGHFQLPTHTEHAIILKSLIKFGAFSLIRNNKSFKETFGQSEKSSIYSNADFFASYLSRMAFLQLSTQTPDKVLSNTTFTR